MSWYFPPQLYCFDFVISILLRQLVPLWNCLKSVPWQKWPLAPLCLCLRSPCSDTHHSIFYQREPSPCLAGSGSGRNYFGSASFGVNKAFKQRGQGLGASGRAFLPQSVHAAQRRTSDNYNANDCAGFCPWRAKPPGTRSCCEEKHWGEVIALDGCLRLDCISVALFGKSGLMKTESYTEMEKFKTS